MKKRRVQIFDKDYEYEFLETSKGVQVLLDGESFFFSANELQRIPFFAEKKNWDILLSDGLLKLKELTFHSSKKEQGQGGLQSPMPGKIFKVLVKDGEMVKEGETLLILEAMKMEHPIKSPRAGRVELPFKEGALVEAGVILALIHGVDKS